MELPSRLLENAVDEISQLPGIGKRNCFTFSIASFKTARESDLIVKFCIRKNEKRNSVL